MTTQSFLIGPVNDGLRKDVKPYAIPEDAFEVLTNAYQWRGRIKRRLGYTALGKLFNGTPVMGLRTRELFGINLQELIAFDTTNAYLFSAGSFTALSTVMPTVWNGTNFNFFWTANYASAFWATNNVPGLHGYAVTLFANQAGGGPWTVQVTAAGNNFMVGDQVYFLNINGGVSSNNLRQAVVTIAGNPFTVSSPVGGAFTNEAVTPGIVLSSTRSKTGQDGIRFYANCSNVVNGVTTPVGNTWVNYNPPVDPNNALCGALMIFPYKGYLVFLGTYEGNDQGVFHYPNRARWTFFGTPFYTNPTPNTPAQVGFEPETMRDDVFRGAGAFDASTNEAIVSAGFIKDILVVEFERSTWRLRFVNNAQNPFTWERTNIEFGSDSTFAAIPFDKGLMNIGNRGIIISDTNDVYRFDEKIPDDVFDIRAENNGFERIYGIRTFRTRLCYWTYPSEEVPNGTFPDKVLVYNYDTKNWSYFDDSFTCFGYFYPQGVAQTWADMTDNWSTYDLTWDSGIDSFSEEVVIAGNQQGYVFMLEQDSSQNSPSLSISGIAGSTITSTNHNLKLGSWITLSGVTGTTDANGTFLNGKSFKVTPVNANDFMISQFAPTTAPPASPTSTELSYSATINFTPIIPYSVNIYIGTDLYVDDGQGHLSGSNGLGIIDYESGDFSFTFAVPYTNTPVNIYIVAYDDEQTIGPVSTSGIYGGGGEITTISNFDIQTKIFNFFKDNKRSRLSRIDFYTNETANGQFTCNVFADSSDESVNTPLSDNLQSNVVLTSPNPYQFGKGDQTIYRLYCDAIAQTVQLQFTLSDRQMAVPAINQSDLEITSLMMIVKKGGRLV